jgi:hypothetical protein
MPDLAKCFLHVLDLIYFLYQPYELMNQGRGRHNDAREVTPLFGK